MASDFSRGDREIDRIGVVESDLATYAGGYETLDFSATIEQHVLLEGTVFLGWCQDSAVVDTCRNLIYLPRMGIFVHCVSVDRLA